MAFIPIMTAMAGEVEPNNFSEGVKLMLTIKIEAWTTRASQTLTFIMNINTGNFTDFFLTLIHTATILSKNERTAFPKFSFC